MWQNWKSRPSCGPEYRSTGLTLQDACGDLGTPQDVERQDTTQVMCFFNVRDAQVAASVPRDEPGRSKLWFGPEVVRGGCLPFCYILEYWVSCSRQTESDSRSVCASGGPTRTLSFQFSPKRKWLPYRYWTRSVCVSGGLAEKSVLVRTLSFQFPPNCVART